VEEEVVVEPTLPVPNIPEVITDEFMILETNQLSS
jgi:hypothetical protein